MVGGKKVVGSEKTGRGKHFEKMVGGKMFSPLHVFNCNSPQLSNGTMNNI